MRNTPPGKSEADRPVTQLPRTEQELKDWLTGRVTYSFQKRRYYLDGKRTNLMYVWMQLVDPLLEENGLMERFGNVPLVCGFGNATGGGLRWETGRGMQILTTKANLVLDLGC